MNLISLAFLSTFHIEQNYYNNGYVDKTENVEELSAYDSKK